MFEYGHADAPNQEDFIEISLALWVSPGNKAD